MGLLTVARDLTRRKARERSGRFVAEGIRVVEELLASPLRIVGALSCDLVEQTPRGAALLAQLHARDVSVLRVSEREFLSACDTDEPQGILAVAEQPTHTLASLGALGLRRLLVLDGIQDPGNVGTLLRTAERTTFAFHGSTVPGRTQVPSTPSAAAVRNLSLIHI